MPKLNPKVPTTRNKHELEKKPNLTRVKATNKREINIKTKYLD